MGAELVHIRDEGENLFIKCKILSKQSFIFYLFIIFIAILGNETEGKLVLSS
jgi:hypothetical protein